MKSYKNSMKYFTKCNKNGKMILKSLQCVMRTTGKEAPEVRLFPLIGQIICNHGTY